MNQEHRKKIDLCCDRVVPRINLNQLLPKLVENKIYNSDDVNMPRWNKHLNDLKTVEDVYLNIKTRGPHAFENLLCSLRQTDHENLADILEGQEITYNSKHTSEKERNDTFIVNWQTSTEPLQVKVKCAEKYLDDATDINLQTYQMRSKPRGLVLLISNIEYMVNSDRLSAKHDEKNIKDLFEQMGFDVRNHKNLTGEVLLRTVKEFSQLKDLRNVDSCFVIITSHGSNVADSKNLGKKGELHNDTELTYIGCVDEGVDGHQKVSCSDVMEHFTAETCPYLAGKPKIFLFQFCRGKETQTKVSKGRVSVDAYGFEPKIARNQTETNGLIRKFSDTLVAYATLPKHVAYRDEMTGSFFLQILCSVFMQHARSYHIEDLLRMVDKSLGDLNLQDKCQTMTTNNIGFNKHCYLNPGLFEAV